MAKKSKMDQLRSGNPVELSGGTAARLNLQDKTLEMSDGRKVYVGDDPDFFPQSEQGLVQSRAKEDVQKGIGQSVFGENVGEALHQTGQTGIFGAGQNWVDKFSKSPEERAVSQRARQEVSEEISEESPYLSFAGKALGYAPDLLLTKGMGGATAGATLGLAHAGPKIIEEPGEALAETAISAAGGHLLDKGVGWLGKVANRRAQSRSMPAQAEAAQQANVAGRQATDQANAQSKSQYNVLREQTKRENEARLHQHELILKERQNKVLDEKNKYDQMRSSREADVIRLKNEYETAKATRSADATRLETEWKAADMAAKEETKRLNEAYNLAERQYQEALKELPSLQKQAQKEFGEGIVKNAGKIERSFPEGAKIYSGQFGADNFIKTAIEDTGLFTTREGQQASRLLKSIFPEGETFTARELSKKYRAIEVAIEQSPKEVGNILNQFKNHMGERLPTILADEMAYRSVIPVLQKQIDRDISGAIGSIGLSKNGSFSEGALMAKAKENVKQMFQQLTPQDFISKMRSGELAQMIEGKILTEADFTNQFVNLSNLKKLEKEGMLGHVQASPAYQELLQQYQAFQAQMQQNVNNAIAGSELKAVKAEYDAGRKIGRKPESTYGMAEEVQTPIAPVAPSPVPQPPRPTEPPIPTPPPTPPPIAPPMQPPMPGKPVLAGEPTAPAMQQFAEQPIPTLPKAQGAADATGDFLERNLLGGNSLVNNPLTKLAGLKYVLGKAALPLEAGYLGLKGLTSPTAGGAAARLTFKQGGLEAINQMAQKYPSYHDGILENPQERRSLTREIEDDYEIPIEEKAVIQSKINRGRPIMAPLQ